MSVGNCPKCLKLNLPSNIVCSRCGLNLGDFKEPRSLFRKAWEGLTKAGLWNEQRSELANLLERALIDHSITDAEIAKLNSLYKSSTLSREDFAKIRDEVFLDYIAAHFVDRRVSQLDRENIFQLAKQVGFSKFSLAQLDSSFYFAEMLQTIEGCPFSDLPTAQNPSILLSRNEIEYFSAPADLLEERVLRSRFRAHSAGVSVPVPFLKGVRSRVGQNRGQSVGERGIVPISSGTFTITNRRMAFSGDRKSVNAPLSKLQDYELFADGLRFSQTNRQKPITVAFDNKMLAEICGVYLYRILNEQEVT